jgi:hypothetical protein
MRMAPRSAQSEAPLARHKNVTTNRPSSAETHCPESNTLAMRPVLIATST